MNEIRIGAAAWGFRELALSQRLSIVRNLGLVSLELGIANSPTDVPMDSDVHLLGQVKTEYQAHGVSLDIAATGNDFSLEDGNAVAADIVKIKKVIDCCAFLGVKTLRIFAGFAPYREVHEKRFSRMIDALNTIARYGEECGVVTAVETHGGVTAYSTGVVHFHSVTTETGCLKRIIRETDECLKFVYDPANLYAISGTDVEEVAEMIGGRIAYAHMKDFLKQPDGRLRPGAVGDENRDWRRTINHILKWTDTLMIEYEVPLDVEEGTRRSKHYLETFLREVGYE